MANTKDFWLPLRAMQWVAAQDERFSLDALKTYVALASIGSDRATNRREEITFSQTFMLNAAGRVFTEEPGRLHPKARFHHAVKALKAQGLLTETGDASRLNGTSGEPYLRSVRRDAKRGNFVMAKALLHRPRTDGTPSPILTLDPEEILLLLLLYQGTRWAWGGVHKQYARQDERGTVSLGSVVTELLEAAREADRANDYGISTARTPALLLESLITGGYFTWLQILTAHATNRMGDKLSTQRTVVFASDLRRDRASMTEPLSTVLVPCYGYTLGNYQPHIVKAIYCGDMAYHDPTGRQLSFGECADLKLWGVDRWRIGTPRK